MEPTSQVPHPEPGSRLSQITTAWTLMFQAHQGVAVAAEEARRKLLEKYSPAIHRYLLGAVRDADAASELFQEFALRLVRGDFRNADPDRGRFRHLLKTSLYHLVIDHQRRKKRTPLPLEEENYVPALDESSADDADREFVSIWRSEVLARSWDALARYERKTGQPYHALLRYRTEHADTRSIDMAEHFGPILGKTLSVAWIRKRLHLAREKFTVLLLEEVSHTLENPSLENLEDELIELELHEHCRAALERRRGLR